jgi:UDP-glucose 4-epimerase
MVEEILGDYAKSTGLKWVALRYFNAAGAGAGIGESHDPETHLVPSVLRAIRTGGPLKVFGDDYDTPDGTCIRDYIHVCDLADAHLLALEKLDKFQGAVNLGTGSGASVREIISTAEKICSERCPVAYAPRRAGDPARLIASNAKAKEILGWRPSRDVEKMISDAWAWEKNRKF